jgi:hypothetical protein
MANNPFYPGYAPKKQDEENVNPIYPGYYAGQPLQRKPSSKEFIKPIEYNVDAYMEGIDNAARKVLLAPFAGPRWMLERIVEDWKDQLKVSIKPAEADVTELDDYSTEEYPGAVIALSLNPGDWKKDPKKQALKTAKEWVKQATGLNMENIISGNDFSDIENKTNKALWLQAMGYTREQEYNPVSGNWQDIIKDAPESIASRTVTQFGKGFDGRDDPINLKDIAVWGQDANGNRVVHKDIYKDTAGAVSDFVEQWDNAREREGKRNKFIHESAKGVYTEIATRATDPRYSNLFTPHQDAIKLLGVQVGVLDDIKGLAKGIKDTNEAVEKITWNKKGDVDKTVAMSNALGDIDTVITIAKNNLATKKLELTGLINSNTAGAEKFNDALKPLEDFVSNLENTRQKIDTKSPKAAYEILSRETRGLIGGGTTDKSIQTKVGEQIKTNVAIGGIAAVVADVKDQGLELHAAKISPIINRLERERIKYATKEVLASWDKEKLLENYVWNKMKRRLPAWAAGTFIGQELEKRNYFGLKVTKAGTPVDPGRLAKFDKKYGYKVNMKLDSSFYGIGKMTIRGGDQFKILKNPLLKKFGFHDPNDEILLKGIFAGKTDRDALAQKLFGCSLANVLSDNKKKEGFDEFLKQMGMYGDWVKDQKETFGNKVLHPDFAHRMLEDLDILNKEQMHGYDLTRKHIGGLEKIHNKALQIKQWWEKTKVGKFIKNMQEWKTIVSERVAKWASNLIAKAFGIVAGATGPLGAILAAAQSVIAFVIGKALAYGEALIKGIFKGDFEDFAKILGKDFNKVLKSCIVCSTIFATIFLLPLLYIIALIATIISPIDRTVGTTLYRPYIAPNRNENDVMIIEKEVDVTLLEHAPPETIHNPSEPIENFELMGRGLNVLYTITVTAKEDIPVVVRLDDVARIKKQGLSIPPFITDSRTIANMKAGQVYKYTLQDILNNENYKNSRVINTVIATIPEIPGVTENEDILGVTRTFTIGYVSPEDDICEGMIPAWALLQSVAVNPNAGPIATKAYNIAYNLERGYWCSFNNSPDYPELWDPDAFGGEMFPTVGEARAKPNAMFWCTWLVIKSYQASDPDFPEKTGAINMKAYFASGGTSSKYNYSFKLRNDVPISQIKSGDVVFYKTYNAENDPPDGYHVGIVYSKTSDSITTVQSNSGDVKLTIPKEEKTDKIIGSITEEGTTLEIQGFGSVTLK